MGQAAERGEVIEVPWHALVPAVVAELAAREPDRPALLADGQQWTYGALAARAAGVGAALGQAGLGRGDPVAVTGRRTPGLVAAMLGVLASGCVLLPIDPALPERRRHRLLAEAGARTVLDTDAVTDPPAASGAELGRLASRIRPEDPAYLVFTSGTTGAPRGVLGLHRGLSHFLAWQRDEFAVGPGDRCAQLTGLSFDVILRDVFLPLTSGGLLCLPPAGEPPPPEETLRWLRDERITTLHAVPTVLRSWLTDLPVPSLRRAFLAGEPLQGQLVNDFRAAVSATVEVVNLYGPTETTLAKSYYRVPSPAPPGPQPVGRPLPQTQIFVVDEAGHLCADGEAGELVIRTPFRTAGYLDGGGFTPNPLRAGGSDPVFRTGDRGFRSADGTLSVRGRLDDQVKIAGVRIEPAEVTAALIAHPGVADAAVLGRTRDDGAGRLAAYVVAEPGVALTAADLRAGLAATLPAAMIPARLTFLARLPVTANGKLDRAALLVIDDQARSGTPVPDGASPGVPGRDSGLEAMAAIWSEVLGREVTAADDFFAMGGHSLHAATILSRVRRAFGTTLAMRTLFEHPTLAEFTEAATDQRLRPEHPEAPR